MPEWVRGMPAMIAGVPMGFAMIGAVLLIPPAVVAVIILTEAEFPWTARE